MAKVEDVLVRAYDVLQDVQRVRYPETDLVRFTTDAVRRARSVRPDLFIGSLATPIAELADGDADFPLPDQFIEPVAMYVAGRAEIRDDEFAVDGRAMTLLGSLTSKLVQGI